MRSSSSPSGARCRCSRPVPLSSLFSASPIPPPSTAVRRPISSRRHHPTSTAPLAPHPSTTSSTTCRRPHLPPLRLRLHRGVQPPTSPWPSSASCCSHPIRLPPNSRHHSIRQIAASTTALAATTTISVGDKLPDAILAYFDLARECQTVTVSELTKGKKTVPFTASSAPLLPPYRYPLPPSHRSSRLRLYRRPGDPHPSLPLSLSDPPSLPSPSLSPCLPSRVPPVGTPTSPPPTPPQHRPPQALFPPLPIPHRKKQHRGKEKKKKKEKKRKKRKKIVRKKREERKERKFLSFLSHGEEPMVPSSIGAGPMHHRCILRRRTTTSHRPFFRRPRTSIPAPTTAAAAPPPHPTVAPFRPIATTRSRLLLHAATTPHLRCPSAASAAPPLAAAFPAAFFSLWISSWTQQVSSATDLLLQRRILSIIIIDPQASDSGRRLHNR